MTNNKFMTKEEFSREVSHIVQKNRCSYMEAVLEMCEKYKQEPEEIKQVLTSGVIDHILAEAQDLNMVEKGEEKASLDILFG